MSNKLATNGIKVFNYIEGEKYLEYMISTQQLMLFVPDQPPEYDE